MKKIEGQHWQNITKNAVFKAERGQNIGDRKYPSVILYPLKDGSGFLWLIWHGWDWNDINRAIKAAGKTRRPYDAACKLALRKLLAYRGRPIATGKTTP